MPKVKKYTVKKQIKITPEQNWNWNPKRIRMLLDQKSANNNSIDINILPIILLKGLYNLMADKTDLLTRPKLLSPEEKELLEYIKEAVHNQIGL